MTKTFLLALMAAAVAAPAFADRLNIDDDGWSLEESPEVFTRVFDIDDDGWSEVTRDVTLSGQDLLGAPGRCMQLELSAGVATANCGSYSRAQVIEMLADN